MESLKKMKRKFVTAIILTGIVSLLAAVNPVFSAENTKEMNMPKIESGRDFGQHVKEHNKRFSGDHNPGKHHKGYSGLK